MAEYLQRGGNQATVAVALYGGVVLLCAVSFCALFLWVTHDERIVGTLPSPEAVKAARIRFSVGLAAYLVAFGLSWVSPQLALALHFGIALYYAFDQASVASSHRRVELAGGADAT
jgi:hypothetical protein